MPVCVAHKAPVWWKKAGMRYRELKETSRPKHAMNFSHPGELAHVIGSWLDHREITDDPDEPGVARVLQIRRGDE